MPESILERTGVGVVRYAQVWEDADVLLEHRDDATTLGDPMRDR